MRNTALPKLLRAMVNSDLAKLNKYDVILSQATIELEKLDNIEIILDSIVASKENLRLIINDNSK